MGLWSHVGRGRGRGIDPPRAAVAAPVPLPGASARSSPPPLCVVGVEPTGRSCACRVSRCSCGRCAPGPLGVRVMRRRHQSSTGSSAASAARCAARGSRRAECRRRRRSGRCGHPDASTADGRGRRTASRSRGRTPAPVALNEVEKPNPRIPRRRSLQKSVEPTQEFEVSTMGNRRSGRRRVPTAVKRARGSQVRHDASVEPTSPAGVPPCPPHLDDDARAAWDAIAARLSAQHVLTTGHGELLALLADGWAQYVRLQREHKRLGYRSLLVHDYVDSRGNKRQRITENPVCRQLRQQALLLNTLFGEFGQTPASAPKVHAMVDGPDPFERFLATPPTASSVVPFQRRKGARA